jgi:hypothetical protein
MTEPVVATEPVAPTAQPTPAPAERGWAKLLIAFAAFMLLPIIPQFRALLPIEHTMMLFVTTMAACALVGWWAGGRVWLALVWVGLAVAMAMLPSPPSAFDTLARGWSLLLAGAFGLVCLFSVRRPFFARALIALAVTLVLATVMSLLGPVKITQASDTLHQELVRRDNESRAQFAEIAKQLPQLSKPIPGVADWPKELNAELDAATVAGVVLFPSLLALESLAALALAWATYHRFARTRLGAPLAPLREFRFNDQLVWGLIVGLVVMVLPTLASARGAGENLLLLFGALYALRGLGVVSWFMAPGRFAWTVGVGAVLLLAPVLNMFAVAGFMMLGAASLVLGLGDTWADWRNRARPTVP